MRCKLALGDSESERLVATTTDSVSDAERVDAAAKDGYDTVTTTDPAAAPAAAESTLPATVASAPPEMTEKTVRGSVPMGVTVPSA